MFTFDGYICCFMLEHRLYPLHIPLFVNNLWIQRQVYFGLALNSIKNAMISFVTIVLVRWLF